MKTKPKNNDEIATSCLLKRNSHELVEIEPVLWELLVVSLFVFFKLFPVNTLIQFSFFIVFLNQR